MALVWAAIAVIAVVIVIARIAIIVVRLRIPVAVEQWIVRPGSIRIGIGVAVAVGGVIGGVAVCEFRILPRRICASLHGERGYDQENAERDTTTHESRLALAVNRGNGVFSCRYDEMAAACADE